MCSKGLPWTRGHFGAPTHLSCSLVRVSYENAGSRWPAGAGSVPRFASSATVPTSCRHVMPTLRILPLPLPHADGATPAGQQLEAIIRKEGVRKLKVRYTGSTGQCMAVGGGTKY